MELQLCYRYTFIDEEPPAAMARSKSEPALGCAAVDEQEAFMATYTVQLQQNAFATFHGHSVPASDAAAAAPVSKAAAAIAPTGPESGSTGGNCGSRGSRGHPHLCRRPCARFAKGECKSGDDCSYCHFIHAKSPSFNKWQRAAMANMDTGTLCSVLLPHIRHALETTQIEGPRLLEIIQTMATASADEVSGTQTDGIDGLQQVDRTLRKFALPALIEQIIRRVNSQTATLLRDEIEALRATQP